ncbi:MAG: HAD-IIA family hydrolase [Candidatus Hydrogenedentes bacterium]|nr:HAD-IIA family hydrolase [Candidatus Hydrogenedentota bacterium]
MLSTIRNFLLDLDGTVYLGHSALPGAAVFIAYLRASGRGLLFFTNNSSADANHYAAKLRRMGIEAQPRDILTSGEATVRYLIAETPYRRVYVLGVPSFEMEARWGGLTVVDDAPDAVVLAFDRTLTYAKLEKACRWLRAGVPYFATNPDRVCPTEDGYIPDCGSMTALLFEATGRRPKVIGKPNPEMVRMALAALNATPDTTAMVGDRLYTDMQMAYDSGITSILVLTGETKKEDLDAATRRPDFVFPSVRELHAEMRGA